MEALTLLGLIILMQINLLLQFMASMGKRAAIRVFTCAAVLPKLTDFSLKLHFKPFHWLEGTLCIDLWLLGFDHFAKLFLSLFSLRLAVFCSDITFIQELLGSW